MKALVTHDEIAPHHRAEPLARPERCGMFVESTSDPTAYFRDLVVPAAVDLADSHIDCSRAEMFVRVNIKLAVLTLCDAQASFFRLILLRCSRLIWTGTYSLFAFVAISPHLQAEAQESLEAEPAVARSASRDLSNDYSTIFQLNDNVGLTLHQLDSAHSHPYIFASSVHDAKENAAEKENGDDKDEKEEDQVTPIVEELFLGKVVYPQEKDEVQLTLGYFDGVEAVGNSELLFEIEYGITDRFQIAFEVPIESVKDETPFEGVRNLGFELYYNFYNERSTGRAYGVGFEFGLPVDAAAGESRAVAYEPFFVAYQEYNDFALNLSAALEIDDPFAAGTTKTTEDLAFGLIGKAGYIVPLLELRAEIAPDETPVLLAPGFYVKSFIKPFDVAVSFPIGLNHDAPDFGVYFLAVVEFEAHEIRSGKLK